MKWAAAASVCVSAVSAPKARQSVIPVAAKSCTAPAAKNSALRHENTAGSSSTRSAPFCTAICARAHLLQKAGSPRCTTLPLITAITGKSPPARRRASVRCSKCPLWKGLYSAITPIDFFIGSPQKVLLAVKCQIVYTNSILKFTRKCKTNFRGEYCDCFCC